MKNYQPRWIVFCKIIGNNLENNDTKTLVKYVSWNQEMWRKYMEETGAKRPFSEVDHINFDRWLHLYTDRITTIAL